MGDEQDFLKRLENQITQSNEAILEIKAGEGGNDSKLFSMNLFEALSRYLQQNGCKVTQLSSINGHVIATVTGNQIWKWLSTEIGVHCVQRIPPTESKGRRHTSYLSVAVLPVVATVDFQIEMKDVETVTQGGHGPGGQHQNKTDSAVRMTHRPTGIQVFVNGRSQHANRREALKILTAKVQDVEHQRRDEGYRELRKRQMSEKGRGHKIRTYNFLNDRAVDHRTGKKTSLKRVLDRGAFELLR